MKYVDRDRMKVKNIENMKEKNKSVKTPQSIFVGVFVLFYERVIRNL